MQEEAEKKAAEEALRIKAEEEGAAEEAKVRMNYQLTFRYKLTNLNAHLHFSFVVSFTTNKLISRKQKKKQRRKLPRKH